MNTLRGASESLFGTSIKLRIRFADAESRKTVSVKIGNKQSEQLLFGPHDAVRGVVHVDSPGGRRLEHTGIRLELIGQIESLLDRTTHEFTSLVRELVREHCTHFSFMWVQFGRPVACCSPRCTGSGVNSFFVLVGGWPVLMPPTAILPRCRRSPGR